MPPLSLETGHASIAQTLTREGSDFGQVWGAPKAWRKQAARGATAEAKASTYYRCCRLVSATPETG